MVSEKIINIGDRFKKTVSKNKIVECEIFDIIKRVSTKTGEVIDIEYYAKSENYGLGVAFEVAKTTILRGR